MGSILSTSRSFSSGSVDLLARLTANGHTLQSGPSDHDLEALRDSLRTAVGWIAGTGPVTAEHLDAAPLLRVIARYGVGFDAVDLQAANDRDIVVTNTPGANTGAVADHAVGLMLSILRGTTDGDRRVRTGDWSVFRGRELGSLTVGILGLGRIGQGVVRRLFGFGSTILGHDPWMTPAQIKACGATPVDVAAMAEQCDIVTLHAPGGTIIIDRDWLAAARPGLAIINTARPDLVDEYALADSLRAGTIAGYAADTLNGDTRGEASPLLAPDLAARVVITPHLGAQTVEAVDNMGSIAVANVLAVLAGETPPHPISRKI